MQPDLEIIYLVQSGQFVGVEPRDTEVGDQDPFATFDAWLSDSDIAGYAEL